MTTETSRLRLPFLSAAQAQKHVTHNEALLMLDALVAARALDRDETDPPEDAVDGDGYIVPAGATGAWDGWTDSFTEMEDGAWRRYLPFEGFRVWVSDEATFCVFDGAGWVVWPELGVLAAGDDAGDVPFAPAGGVAATNVQAAIAELDSEKAAASHTHTSAAVTDFVEAAQDAVAAMAADTATIDVTYTDATPELKWDVRTGSIGNTLLASMAQATLKGRASGAGTGDPADLSAAQVKTILALAAADISDFTEAAQDAVLGVVADGTTVDFTYNDAGNALTAEVKDNALVAGKATFSATDKLLGRATSGAGAGEEIACTATGRSILDDASVAAVRNTIAAGWGIILPETRALINAMTSEPRRALTFLVDDTIRLLIDAGLWAKLDALWVMAAADSQGARLNWRNPGTWTLTAVNAPTFTASHGYAGDGATSRLETGVAWNGLSQFTLNSAHLGYRIDGGTDAAANKAAVGSISGSSGNQSRPRDSGGAFAANLNAGTLSNLGSGHGTILGHFIASRRGASELEGYFNGTSLGTDNDASASVSTTQIVTHYHNSIYADFRLNFLHLGAGLSDSEAADMTTILAAYMAGL